MANDTDIKSEKKAAPAVKPFIFIINNGLGHRTLALRGAVNTTSKTLVDGPRIELKVGTTIVERRLWDRWKKENANVEIDGVLHVGQATTLLSADPNEGTIPRTRNNLEGEGKPWLEEGPEVSTRDNPLSVLDERDARRVVAETLDEPTLKKWLNAEKRPAIAAVLSSKIEYLQKEAAAGASSVRAMG